MGKNGLLLKLERSISDEKLETKIYISWGTLICLKISYIYSKQINFSFNWVRKDILKTFVNIWNIQNVSLIEAVLLLILLQCFTWLTKNVYHTILINDIFLAIKFHTISCIQKIVWNLFNKHFPINGNCMINILS